MPAHLPITLLSEATSTSDLALQAAAHGAPHGACWVADHQTTGRGRRQSDGSRRAWYTCAGQNLTFSTLLRPQVDPARAAQLTLAAGVGVARAVRAVTGLKPWLKWPNDLYLGDRKLCGILSEAHFDAGQLSAVIVGVGLNVNMTELPEQLADHVTSLALVSGQRWDRMSLVLAARDALVDACDQVARGGLEVLAEALAELDGSPGRQVRWQDQGAWRRGEALGIATSGALRVRDELGQELALSAGEVHMMGLSTGARG